MGAIAVLLVLGGLIFFHELGHFLMARSLGIGVKAFALGFGPKIFSFTWGMTEYRLCAECQSELPVRKSCPNCNKEIDWERLNFEHR